MLDMGVSVTVSGEALSIINFIPIDSVVGVENLVGFNPLIPVCSSLSLNSNPFLLYGTSNLNPLVSVVGTC